MSDLASKSRRPSLQQLLSGMLVIAASCSASAQSPNADPGHKAQLSLAGVSFSCPSGFIPQRTDSNFQVAYMRHEREDLALFVAIPQPGAGDEYVEHLGSFLVSYLFPEEWAVFAWKRMASALKTSKFETAGGTVNGFNGAQAVTLEYKRLQVNGSEIIAGYVVGAGRDGQIAESAGRSLEVGSAAGRSGLTHVIASMTGERYVDLATAQDVKSDGSQGRDRAIALANNPPSVLRQSIQATLARFRNEKMKLPANFSLALTFSISEKGELAYLSVVQSSGSKEIDEAALEIVRKAGDSGVLGFLKAASLIKTALDFTPASVHFSIAWPSTDEQQAAERATKLCFLLKVLAAQQRKKSAAIAEALGLVHCKPDGKLVVLDVTAPRERWSEWTRAWFGGVASPDAK